MDEERKRFVEEFATLWSGFGLPRMQGKVMGALLVSDPSEKTAEELMETLQASRGSISQATRSLVQMGLVERRARIDDRRDYFRTRTDWADLLRQQISIYSAFKEIAERGLEIMATSSPESRRDLEEMRSLYAYLEREMPAFIGRW